MRRLRLRRQGRWRRGFEWWRRNSGCRLALRVQSKKLCFYPLDRMEVWRRDGEMLRGVLKVAGERRRQLDGWGRSGRRRGGLGGCVDGEAAVEWLLWGRGW